jgi:predicted metal-dependent peptidase
MADAGGPFTHRGTRAIQHLVEYAPSTGGLALWVKHQDVADDALSVPVATDGNTLFYGATFGQRPLLEQVGLVAHEVLHLALRHPQRYLDLQHLLGDVDLRLFTICSDAIVNSALSHLTWLKLPAGSVFLDELLEKTLRVQQNVEKSLLEWDVERLYRSIDDRKPLSLGAPRDEPKEGQKATKGSQGGAGKSSKEGAAGQRAAREDGPKASKVRELGKEIVADLLPGPDTKGSPEAEAESAREWNERVVRGHAGDGAHSMLRTLLADLPKSRVPWEQVLRTLLAHSLSPSPAVSWSRPSRSYLANQGRIGTRRMPWEPGISASKAVPRLVVIIDVSGSIDDALMQRFAREVQAITRRLEAGLTLILGDDRVQRVEHFGPGEADLGGVAFNGGGGTDFTPLLEEADTHQPDIAVVLTDLDGPARFRPRWPVVWAVPESHAAVVPPFGRLLPLRA